MKWRPIPESEYEINSAKEVRNAKTGRLMKVTNGCCALFIKGRLTKRSVAKLWRQVTAEVGKYEPVPGTKGQYEMSPSGIMRNAVTKQELKIRGGCWSLKINGEWKQASRASLMWEMYGVIKIPQGSAHPVTVTRGARQLYFDSFTQAAQFLSRETHYVTNYIKQLLTRRDREIFGWTIKYPEDAADLVKMGWEARHQSAVWNNVQKNGEVVKHAEEIKAKRRELGLTQEGLSRRMGLAAHVVGAYERGRMAIPEGFMEALRRL